MSRLPTTSSSSSNEDAAATITSISFSHVQIFTDKLEDLYVYKQLESQLNEFDGKLNHNVVHVNRNMTNTILENSAKKVWKDIAVVVGSNGEEPTIPTQKDTFTSHNRDIVKQLIAGLGFRVSRARYGDDTNQTTNHTRSVLVTSRDPNGVQFLVTALNQEYSQQLSHLSHDHISLFDKDKVKRFMEAHFDHMGIGVLAFNVDNVEDIKRRYEQIHPVLIDSYQHMSHDVKVLDVFAYYISSSSTNKQEVPRIPDNGTVLRFIESNGNDSIWNAFGMYPIDTQFDSTSKPAYCDHWVSNVFSRTEFLETLRDTLGFTPKVDFNAGVVAAGEAQIESTVTGNTSLLSIVDSHHALRDQSQVYLPINNALSSVGHVHGFLRDLSQGVQHIASRVENLVDFVQRANNYRIITGEGFSFLNIPRSYYGTLTGDFLVRGLKGDQSDAVSETCASDIIRLLNEQGVLSKDGAVDIDLDHSRLRDLLDMGLNGSAFNEYKRKRGAIIQIITHSRFRNLFTLLGHHVSEETYLGIVRNKILVDIQGDDLLYQIFTSNVLQRRAGDEAPFFEFIQRVCSQRLDECGCPRKIRPGCGGFGIRNFLTLFLSIEVSKAMYEVADATTCDDFVRLQYAQAMVDCFTAQLNDSNPILSEISEAMTEEGYCNDKILRLTGSADAEIWKTKLQVASDRKRRGNERLLECSSRYNAMMKQMRESHYKDLMH